MRSTPMSNWVFAMVYKIGIILFFGTFLADALWEGDNNLKKRYLIKNQDVSKSSAILTRPFDHRDWDEFEFDDPFCLTMDDIVLGHRQKCRGGRHRIHHILGRCRVCMHGNCIVNRICLCQAGWTGAFCDQACPTGKWGRQCRQNCNCQNGALCDERDGHCTCKDGWKGRNCNEPCSEEYFGYNCKQICQCKNNATCHHISGSCNCTAGYQGPLCEDKCPIGSHGYQCSDECKCQNDAICHHVDGSCDCPLGWTGPVCAERCPEGLFGTNCSEICNCHNNATCDFITGECICTEEFYGENCEIHCSSEDWGMNRSQECSCENEECSGFIGNCSCHPGFYGSICQIRDCPANKWGYNCSNECNCSNYSSCHPITGACCCEDPWTGEDCSLDSTASLKQRMVQAGISSSVTVAFICIAIIVLILIIIGVVYYKRHRIRWNKFLERSNISRFSLLKNDE